MNILSWVLFGLITGIIAYMLDAKENGLVFAMVLGVAGAVSGGLLANVFFGSSLSGFNLASFMLSVAGSLMILILSKALRKV